MAPAVGPRPAPADDPRGTPAAGPRRAPRIHVAPEAARPATTDDPAPATPRRPPPSGAGRTALAIAVDRGFVELAALLLERGVEPDGGDGSPLSGAAARAAEGDVAAAGLVKALLRAGASAATAAGDAALGAAARGPPDVAEALLARGARPLGASVAKRAHAAVATARRPLFSSPADGAAPKLLAACAGSSAE